MHIHYTHTLNTHTTHTLICRDQLRDSLLAIITQQSKKPLSAALVAPATLASLSSWYSPFPFFLFSHKHLKNCSNLMYHLQVERRLRGWLRFCVGFWFFSLFVFLAFFLAFSLSLSSGGFFWSSNCCGSKITFNVIHVVVVVAQILFHCCCR